MNHNFKTLGVNEAKKAFITDLQNDKDYIQYKNTSESFGTVNSYARTFMIDKAISSESLITAFHHNKI